MRKVLYLLKDFISSSETVFPLQRHADQTISVILLQEAVAQRDVPADHVYVLSEDAVTRQIMPIYPTISYQDMVRMMFEADSVVAL